MNPYPSYRDSGVEWIGEIPRDWSISKLKYDTLTPVKYGMNISSDKYIEEGIRFIRITDLTDWGELIKNNGKYLIKDDVSDEFLLDKYDLLLCRSGHTVGKSYLHNEDGDYTSGGYLVKFNFGNYTKSKFIFYISKTDFYWYWIQLNTVTSTIENVNGEKYSNMVYPKPPSSEQTQIVSFLDTKTQKIDELIEKTEQKIKLLKEKRTSLINHCVTKGLNPDVEMKDSGVEWIGEIPIGWNKIKVKYLGDIKSGDGLESSLIEPEGEFPVYGGNGVMGYYSDFNSDIPILIIGRVGEKCGNVHYEDSKVWINDNSLVFQPNEKVKSIKYLFHSFEQRNFNQLRNKNTQPLITGTLVKNEYTPYPPFPEQTQIVEYLDEQTQKIDSTIEKETQRIELLKEYRQSLISEVVTGKIDVRDWKE